MKCPDHFYNMRKTTEVMQCSYRFLFCVTFCVRRTPNQGENQGQRQNSFPGLIRAYVRTYVRTYVTSKFSGLHGLPIIWLWMLRTHAPSARAGAPLLKFDYLKRFEQRAGRTIKLRKSDSTHGFLLLTARDCSPNIPRGVIAPVNPWKV